MTSFPQPDSLLPSTHRALHHRVAKEQRSSRLPSVSVGMTRDNKLVHTSCIGTRDGREGGTPVSADTQYRMGSITKTFVAVEVMRLRDEGQLDLSDTYETHVPGTGIGGTTIAGLLSHTSGTQAETSDLWWERTPGGSFEELGSSVEQKLRQGRAYHYSNVGFGALGELVSRKRGSSWFDAVSKAILEPLGMTRTTTRPSGDAAMGFAVHPYADVLLPEPEHDAEAMAPAGQYWSTITDLARWAAFVNGDTGDLLSADTLAEMCEVQTVGRPASATPWIGGHGLGWQLINLNGTLYAGHSGSMPGFIANMFVAKNGDCAGDGVIMMMNSTVLEGRSFLSDLARILHEAEPTMPTPWHADTVDPAVMEIVGPWYWGPASTPIRATGGSTFFLGEPNGGRSSRFTKTGTDTYIGLDTYHQGETLRVIRDESGAVSHIDLQTFRYTRTPYDPNADVPGGVDAEGWQPVASEDAETAE